jgi:hypothetical protein
MSVNYSYTVRVSNCAARSLRDSLGVSGHTQTRSLVKNFNFSLSLGIIPNVIFLSPIPVAAWSNAWVCVLSLAGIAGSNPARIMDVCCVLWVKYICNGSNPNQESSYRMWCVWVLYRNINNEAGFRAMKKVSKINRSFFNYVIHFLRIVPD